MSLTETNRLRAAMAAASTVRKLDAQCERADAPCFDKRFDDALGHVMHCIVLAAADAEAMLEQRRAERGDS